MKLSKTSRLILGIGILAILFGGMEWTRWQQAKKVDELARQVPVAEARLAKIDVNGLAAEKVILDERLKQIRTSADADKTRLSRQIDGIEASNMLFSAARGLNVQIVEINTSERQMGELAGVPVSLLPVTMRIEGDFPGVLAFIYGLSDGFPAGVVQAATVAMSDNVSQASSASIQLRIYRYSGS